VVFDPDTYVRGVPFEAFARLREREPGTWVEEVPVGPWPAGPGYWAVWRHADVRQVLRQPGLFSSRLGATQIRNPATPDDLAHVRRSMLNKDPPEPQPSPWPARQIRTSSHFQRGQRAAGRTIQPPANVGQQKERDDPDGRQGSAVHL
jgi:hypothetical protein